jgi:hypothetical protein
MMENTERGQTTKAEATRSLAAPLRFLQPRMHSNLHLTIGMIVLLNATVWQALAALDFGTPAE